MKRLINFETTTALIAIGVLAISFLMFRYLVWFVPTDITLHASMFLESVNHGWFPIPFLYPLTIYTFAGFKADIYMLWKSSIIVLSIAVMIKYLTTVHILNILTSEKNIYLLIVACCLLICAPISWSINQMYLGKTSINVWHNSTTIMTMPFVILLFGSIIKFLQDDNIKIVSIFSIVLFSILNIVTKPSFVFAVIPALPLGVMIYQRQWFSHKITMASLISLLLLSLIIRLVA